MSHPSVLDEYETLRRVRDERLSLARYGDGEIKLCRGASCKPQAFDPSIQKYLRLILRDAGPKVLVGVPNIWSPPSPLPVAKEKFWRQYRTGYNASFYSAGAQYGSSFVSRPDSAPWIDRPNYWALARSIWQGRPVIFVTGAKKGMAFVDHGLLDNAASIDVVRGPRTQAWDQCGSIAADMVSRDTAQRRAGRDPLVILALGPTATVLAGTIGGREGMQVLDLGHMGIFYRDGNK